MKPLFVLLTVALSYSARAQFYIGFTEKEVRQQIIEREQISSSDIQKVFNKDGTWYIAFSNSKLKSSSVVLFDTSGLSCGVAMIPDDTYTFNIWVEDFNRNYIPMSDTTWKFYSAGNIYIIEAVYNDKTDHYTVLFTRQKNK